MKNIKLNVYNPFVKLGLWLSFIVSSILTLILIIPSFNTNLDFLINNTNSSIVSEINWSLIHDTNYNLDLLENTEAHNYRYTATITPNQATTIEPLESYVLKNTYKNEKVDYELTREYEILKTSIPTHEYYLSSKNIQYTINLHSSDFLYQELDKLFKNVVVTEERTLDSFFYDDYYDSLTPSSTVEDSIYATSVGTLSYKSYFADAPSTYNILFFYEQLLKIDNFFGNALVPSMFIFLIISLISFCFICASTGRKNDTKIIHLNFIDKIPLDLYLFVTISFGAIIMFLCGETFRNINSLNIIVSYDALFLVLTTALIFSVLLIASFITIVKRIKSHTLISNNLTWKLLCFILLPFKKIIDYIKSLFVIVKAQYKDLSIVSHVVVVLGIYFLVSVIFSLIVPISFVANIIEKIIIFPIIISFAIIMRKLQKGAEIIASGNMSYNIDTKYLIGDLKKHAETLNTIQGGLSFAVEEKLKSERLKSELITNVSHDIKTPLTSIINYVDLISKEETNNPKIKEYTEVLSRHSNRLKKLINDLLSASKASTGNIDISYENCELITFSTQIIGEYKSRLEAKNLILSTIYPDNETVIKADGKLMWRIFDNLFNNICKFAQEGTRVYFEIKNNTNNITITLKNISKYELNISADELTERFARGDKSRHTEGSGLGLSIAKSLVELQGGAFEVIIDGDLFKIIITMPI